MGDDPAGPECSFRRPHWHGAIERECSAVANGVALADLPGAMKFQDEGAGAAAWLDHLIAGRLPGEGRTALSHCCSPRGGIVSQMTVSHLADGRFWLMSAAAGERHDEAWLHSHLSQRHGPVSITNLTARYGSLVVAGPRSRELLARVSAADLSNATFPWLAVRTIRIADTVALAMRVSYVGELGWELHLPGEELPAVYERVVVAGREVAAAPFGLYAMGA